MSELDKYTPEEGAFKIPCRAYLPSEDRCMLIDLTAIPERAMSIDVIAHSLATKARYNGHTPWPYNVALHSILVSMLLEDDSAYALRFEAVLHDAAEAFVGDMIHPIKRELPEFKRIESLVEAQIRGMYALPAVETPAVKEADTKALWLEQHMLQGKVLTPEMLKQLDTRQYHCAESVLREEISWKTSRQMYLMHFDIVFNKVKN